MYSGEREGYKNLIAAHLHQQQLEDGVHFLGKPLAGVFGRFADKVSKKLETPFLATSPLYKCVWPEITAAMAPAPDDPDAAQENLSEVEASEEDFGEGEAEAEADQDPNDGDGSPLDNMLDEGEAALFQDFAHVPHGKDDVASDVDSNATAEMAASDVDEESDENSDAGINRFGDEEHPESHNEGRPASPPADPLMERFQDYFEKPQDERKEIWDKHRNVDRSNIVSGRRKRRRPVPGVFGMAI